MCEIAIGLTVDHRIFHAQSFQQFGKDDTTYRVDCVDCYFEMRIPYGISVNQFQCKNTLNMTLIEGAVLRVFA